MFIIKYDGIEYYKVNANADVKSLPGASERGRLCCICNRTQYIKREQDFSF